MILTKGIDVQSGTDREMIVENLDSIMGPINCERCGSALTKPHSPPDAAEFIPEEITLFVAVDGDTVCVEKALCAPHERGETCGTHKVNISQDTTLGASDPAEKELVWIEPTEEGGRR